MTFQHFELHDEVGTTAWAASLARSLKAQSLVTPTLTVHLSGDLGAGKTALVRAVLHSLGHVGPVRSPSFALLEPYDISGWPVYHFDLYRFTSPAQWFDAGFDEYADGPGLLLIEWPEQAAGALNAPDLHLSLDWGASGPQSRSLRVDVHTNSGETCLQRLMHDPDGGLRDRASGCAATGSKASPAGWP